MKSIPFALMLVLFAESELSAQSSSPCVISFPANTEILSKYEGQEWQDVSLFTPPDYKKSVYRRYRTSIGEELPLYEHTFQGKVLYRDTILRRGSEGIISSAKLMGAWRSPQTGQTFIFLNVMHGILHSDVISDNILIFLLPEFHTIKLELSSPSEIKVFAFSNLNWIMVLAKEWRILGSPPNLEGFLIDISQARPKVRFRLSDHLGSLRSCFRDVSQEVLEFSQKMEDFLRGKAGLWVSDLCAVFDLPIRLYEIEKSDGPETIIVLPVEWSSDELTCRFTDRERNYTLAKPMKFIVLRVKWR